MPDDDEMSGRPKEEALLLKTMAEEKYSSGDLNSAITYANRARDLCPSIPGLPEMLTAFEILRAAAVPVFDSVQKSAPDYYTILQVQRFSHINSIKKQYKKLALILHPDKNPFEASEAAFKLVGEAARVLSDKIRRKEYDTRLRIAMQSEAAHAVALGPEEAGEAFSTACSACGVLHLFERKYLGHNLMCPSCKKTFKAMEVQEAGKDEGDVERNEGVGGGQTRVSARLQERVAKGGYVGIVEKSGLGLKRRNGGVGEVSEKSKRVNGVKSKRVEIVDQPGEGEGGGGGGGGGGGVENGDGTVGGGDEEVFGTSEMEMVKRAEVGEDDVMTLSQMKMMVKKKTKKKKPVDAKLITEVNEKENIGEEERPEEANLRKSSRRRVAKSHIHSEVLLMEKENENGTLVTREKKRERRRLPNSDIETLIANNNGEVEIMPVEESEFHDFDKDRRDRSFKKGQIWALYDDDDGMPRHYALVNEIVSLNPFELKLTWLHLQTKGDIELTNWLEKGFHASCGIFKLTHIAKIRFLNLFSHLVDCERAARELYRIYPNKGSVWAVYDNTSVEDERCYNYKVVVSLTSYSDLHGVSIGYLDRVAGFRAVYKRREVGANGVVCLGAGDVKMFSHQIPAKKLCGVECSGLPKDCWELDPASLTPQLLSMAE